MSDRMWHTGDGRVLPVQEMSEVMLHQALKDLTQKKRDLEGRLARAVKGSDDYWADTIDLEDVDDWLRLLRAENARRRQTSASDPSLTS